MTTRLMAKVLRRVVNLQTSSTRISTPITALVSAMISNAVFVGRQESSESLRPGPVCHIRLAGSGEVIQTLQRGDSHFEEVMEIER